jgi:CHAD domain-containing protein
MPPTPQEREVLLQAFRKRWKRFDKELNSSQKKISEDGVHDLRVAIRRYEAVLDVYQAFRGRIRIHEGLAELNFLLEPLGELRNAQVQRGMVESLLGEVKFSTFQFHRYLSRRVEKRLNQLVKRMGTFEPRVNTVIYEKVIADLSESVSGPVRTRATVPVENKISKKVLKKFLDATALFQAPIENNLDLVSLHKMRLAYKKFRYATEVLQDPLGTVGEELFEQMHQYQDQLGKIHDLDLLIQQTQKFIDTHSLFRKQGNQIREFFQKQLDEEFKNFRDRLDFLDELSIKIGLRNEVKTIPPQATISIGEVKR